MHEITLELTNQCYNNCLHCSSCTSLLGNKYLKLYQIKQIINQYNPEWVNLSGGEPFLYPDLISLINWLKEKRIKIKIYTSGNVAWESIKKVYELNIDKIIFSLHSHYDKLHNFITQNMFSYDTTVENILNSQSINKNIEIHIVPMSITVNTLSDTIDYLYSNRIKNISLLKLVNQGRCKDNQFLLLNNYNWLSDIKNKYNNIRIGSPFDNTLPCTAGKEKLVVMSNGTIIPCESYKDGNCKCERSAIYE